MKNVDFTKSAWWLWIPLAVTATQLVLERILSPAQLAAMLSENGPHEALQFLVIGAAFFVGLLTLIRMPKDNKWLVAWVTLATLCCFYVAGEEMSWGQWIFKWGTPEFWSTVNDQNETNLHNTSSWLDQKPRALLTVGILVGGLIIPLLRKIKPSLLPVRFEKIYPPSRLCIIALLLLAFELAKAIQHALHIRIFERASEIQELFMFYFVLLYLLELRQRLRSAL